MKKLLILSFFIYTFLCLSVNKSNADVCGAGFHYLDGGTIFTNTTMPVDVGNAINSKPSIDLKNLKCGEAVSRNILFIVDVGNSGIDEAARKAGIKQIRYVDSKTCKVFIPLGFIPILVKETKTLVYGE